MAMTETSREVGVVLRRRAIDNPWIDHMWSPAMVLDEVPDTAPWTVLSTRGRCDDLLCGCGHHRSVQYGHGQLSRQPRRRRAANLDSAAAPGRRAELELTKVTADPTEGEAMFESGCDVIGTVPMPPDIAAWIAAFVDRVPCRARVPQAQARSQERRTQAAAGRPDRRNRALMSDPDQGDEDKGFLARWSQRKQEAKQPEPKPDAPAAEARSPPRAGRPKPRPNRSSISQACRNSKR